MTTPPYDHIWATPSPAPIPQAIVDHLQTKARVAEARSAETRRRAADLQTQVDQMGARLADLEHPADTTAPATDPARVTVSETHGPTLTGPDDTAWVISGWREQGWAT